MKNRYYWREISKDGLLKLPETYGPYYDDFGVDMGQDGFDSEEGAVKALEEFYTRYKKDYGKWVPTYILIKEYYDE